MILLALLVLLGPWILVAVGARRRREDARRSEQQLGALSRRMSRLEEELAKLRALNSRIETLERAIAQGTELPPPIPADVPAVAVPFELAKPPAERVTEKPAPPKTVVPERPQVPEPLPVPAPRIEPSAAASTTAAGPPSAAAPAFITPQKSAISVGAGWKRILNIEEVLGTNWLNKLGVIILVIGIALFLAYQLQHFGPAGKVMVGYAVGFALLGGGIFLERRDRYRILARAALGGGWSLIFFTTYAMHHVPAARVISSQAIDLVLLLVAAATMVVHTLRYNSQVVTGLAFLLGFSTVTISHSNAYSLSAGAILAAGLATIAVRRRWFILEVFGILATYLNHYIWLRYIIEPMRPNLRPFPEFFPSVFMLVLYWGTFRLSYLMRRINATREETVSSVAALLNASLLLVVMRYQAVHPEWAFWCLLAFGAVELSLGQLPASRDRRKPFVVLTTIGATLLVAALPFRYSGAALAILWLAESEAFFLAGVFTREIVFRRLGMAAGLLVAGKLNWIALEQLSDPHWQGIHGADLWKGALVFATAVLVFYVNAHWVRRRAPDLVQTRLEDFCFRGLSYIAGVAGFVGIWWLAPEAWVVVGWSALALGLAVVGNRRQIQELTIQANCLAYIAVLRALSVNTQMSVLYHNVTLRLITISLVIILLYLLSRWNKLPAWEGSWLLSPATAWAASVLLGVLVWYELQPASVALAWTLQGLILFELGFARSSASLRFQGYLAMAASLLRIFIVNLNAADTPGELSPRLYTTVPLALAFYYLYWRLAEQRADFLRVDRRIRAPELNCYLGTLTVAAIMRFELNLDWVATGWSALILILVVIAWRFRQRMFLHQALLLGVVALFRTVFHNFYQPSYFVVPTFWQGRIPTVGAAVALLFLTLPLACRLQLKQEGGPGRPGRIAKILQALTGRPEQVLFFIPFVLLTILLHLEMRYGMATLAWGIEAVAVFMFALAMGQRSYRLAALGLLLLCVAKIVAVDVWGLTPRDRYLTFIGLGAALLAVSFLYTRCRDTLMEYL